MGRSNWNLGERRKSSCKRIGIFKVNKTLWWGGRSKTKSLRGDRVWEGVSNSTTREGGRPCELGAA